MDEIAELPRHDADPRDEIVRLEARIEQLSETIEGCRKFILAARLATLFGGALLVLGLFGLVQVDGLVLSAGFAGVLGGIVVLGSNSSTQKEAMAERTAAEADRAALIGMIELRVVAERPTLH